MEAIIKTIDEEYMDKCMDAGMKPGSNLPAGSALGEPGVSSLPGKGGAKKKSAKSGGFSGGKKLGENAPAGIWTIKAEYLSSSGESIKTSTTITIETNV